MGERGKFVRGMNSWPNEPMCLVCLECLISNTLYNRCLWNHLKLWTSLLQKETFLQIPVGSMFISIFMFLILLQCIYLEVKAYPENTFYFTVQTLHGLSIQDMFKVLSVHLLGTWWLLFCHIQCLCSRNTFGYPVFYKMAHMLFFYLNINNTHARYGSNIKHGCFNGMSKSQRWMLKSALRPTE